MMAAHPITEKFDLSAGKRIPRAYEFCYDDGALWWLVEARPNPMAKDATPWPCFFRSR